MSQNRNRKPVGVTLSEKIIKALDEYCEKEGCSRSWAIESLLKKVLFPMPSEEWQKGVAAWKKLSKEEKSQLVKELEDE